MTDSQRIESILEPLPRRFIVIYAVAVTEDCFLAAGDSKVPETAKYTLSLTKQWLKDSSSVTEKQLRDAADASYAAAYTANAAYTASASYAASYAVAYTANASYAAAHAYAASAASYAAAYAAAYADASYAASYAANAAAYAAAYAPHRNLNYYLKMLYTMMDKLPKLYKVVYGIEKLNSYSKKP